MSLAQLMKSPAFCPTCDSPLQVRPVLDPNLKGYACENGDRFYTTRTVYHGDRAHRTSLSAELSDDDLPQQLAYYTSNYRYILPYVHPQMRDVLGRFAESFLNSGG
jgi:hypothetical protein